MSKKEKHIPSGYSVLHMSNKNGWNTVSVYDTATDKYDEYSHFTNRNTMVVTGSTEKHADALMETLHAFLNTINPENEKDKKRGQDYDYEFNMQRSNSYEKGNTIVLSTPTAKAFFNFYVSLVNYSQVTYDSGLAQGKNLLQGLNDGTLTMSDFNEK